MSRLAQASGSVAIGLPDPISPPSVVDSSLRLRREIAVFTCICIVGLAVGFPSFFPAVHNWDESTWIIVGQSAVDGHLPGEVAWDLKPPLVFWWFGAAIELSGRSIPGIRFLGFLWLALSAYTLYRVALSIRSSRLGAYLAAMIVIVAGYAFALHVSTERLALLPLTGAMLVLGSQRLSRYSLFLGGFLVGAACMFRLNLGYLGIVVGAFLCFQAPYSSPKAFLLGALRIGSYFSSGVLLAVVLCFLPYLLMGRSDLPLEFFEGAIAYSDQQLSFNNVIEIFASSYSVIGVTLWSAATAGAWMIWRRWNDLSPEERFSWSLYGAFAIGSFLSIVLTGPFYRHYFLQLVPSLAIFAAAIFIPPKKSSHSWAASGAKLALSSALIAAILQISYSGWGTITDRLIANEPLSSGPAYAIADFIRGQGLKNYTLFVLDRHTLVYWLLNRYPPTRLSTHPSALAKPSERLTVEPKSRTTKDALTNVFLQKPTFVVLGGRAAGLRGDAEAQNFLRNKLNMDYTLIGTKRGAQIFRRKASLAIKDRDSGP